LRSSRSWLFAFDSQRRAELSLSTRAQAASRSASAASIAPRASSASEGSSAAPVLSGLVERGAQAEEGVAGRVAEAVHPAALGRELALQL
jgi:hypothetical protein